VDLGTTDVAAGKAFYGTVLGWATADVAAGDDAYTLCHVDGRVVAGLYGLAEPPLGVPVWSSYVTVTDADAAAGRADELGATLEDGVVEVGDRGRMVVFQDPEGAELRLWEPRQRLGAALVNEPGALVWNELGTRDPDAAQRFYGDLFGWTFEPDEERGYVTIRNRDARNGGIRRITPMEGDTPAHWLPTFGVRDLDLAVAAVGRAGGQVLAGPMDIAPGRVAVVKDPQRAPLMLYEGRFEP
jgi:predicted enzyme related to lactoylglutathione lyase